MNNPAPLNQSKCLAVYLIELLTFFVPGQMFTCLSFICFYFFPLGIALLFISDWEATVPSPSATKPLAFSIFVIFGPVLLTFLCGCEDTSSSK